MEDGKVSFEAVKKVAEVFDEAEGAGLASDDEVVAEIVPMLQQRLRDQAVKAGIESYGKRGTSRRSSNSNARLVRSVRTRAAMGDPTWSS
jgi:hypothetical protein